jgi:hypothetical protein
MNSIKIMSEKESIQRGGGEMASKLTLNTQKRKNAC